MEWVNKIANEGIKTQISTNDALIRKIHVLIHMSATQIKTGNKKLLKGVSINIATELYMSDILSESQYNRIKKQKESLKRIK
jgi:hypothetical protein